MRRWAALALLLGATGATLATIAVVVFQLADDGGALVAEAGRPSARRCRLTKLKLQTRLGARHSRLRSPLRREGPGLVLLGAAGGRRAAARAALAYALAQTQIDGADARLPCCADPEWDFRKRPVRQALRGGRWPREAWLAPGAYHPFLTAMVPAAFGQFVVHVRDPMDLFVGAWAPRPLRALLRVAENASAATHAATQRAVAPLRLSRQARAVVGLAAPADPCFATYFESRLDALATGRWRRRRV